MSATPPTQRDIASSWIRVLAAGVLLLAAVRAHSQTARVDLTVGSGGQDFVALYTHEGTELKRFLGFEAVSDIVLYDDRTVLVAEQSRNRILAFDLEGRVLWEAPAHRPRCLQVLEPGRFLVCQDDPPKVTEIDLEGNVLWEVAAPLTDAAAALRLPDGRTAVVEGRGAAHAIRVLSPDGAILWSGTESLAQPRGLALLPSGELVTSGFDTNRLVFFTPFTAGVRTLPLCCHPMHVSSTGDGGVIAASPEQQFVGRWGSSLQELWSFPTPYPPHDAELLPDGNVVVSMVRHPDRECMNAEVARARHDRPSPPYLRWLLAGTVTGVLAVLLLQGPLLLRRPTSTPAESLAPAPSVVGRRRRLELGAALIAISVLAVVGAALQGAQLRAATAEFWPFALSALAGGAGLALLRSRMSRTERAPAPPTDRMARPNWRMSTLWVAGLALVAAATATIAQGGGHWTAGLWSAGLMLLVGGAIEVPLPARRRPRSSTVVGLILLALLVGGLRLYRLGDYPPNLHHDMALATLQGFRLMDGEVQSLFGNGWADIPLVGYLWQGAVGDMASDRSLAAIRLPSALGSILAILFASLLSRGMFGPPAGWITALVLGFDHSFLHFSRTQAYMDPVPLQVLAVLGLWRGLKSGRFLWFAVAGCSGAFATLSYHSGRITPLLLSVLTGVFFARHPSAIRRRWPGIVLSAAIGLAALAPQLIVYGRGNANPYGRFDQFSWLEGGRINRESLQRTIDQGWPTVPASLWFGRDSSTQYGGATYFVPALGALLAISMVAALLRPADVAGLWLLVWAGLTLFVGGVLTVDPPFWPRLVSALVPVSMLAAAALATLYDAARMALPRLRVLAAAAVIALLCGNAWAQLQLYDDYLHGRYPGHQAASFPSQWPQVILGRDVQRWGPNALFFVVARNHNQFSCSHPAVQYFVDEVDARDARDIGDYLPFPEGRLIVAYFDLETSVQIAKIQRLYPGAEQEEFHNNLGRHLFTRVVVRPERGGRS